MKIITGSFEKVKKQIKIKMGNEYFEFFFPYVEESADRFREIDRFLYESRKHTRFKNAYIGNIVIDISEWNNNRRFNNYFDAFMYFIIDNMNLNRFIFTADKPCNRELFERLQKYFKIEEMCLEAVKPKQKIKIGFALPEEKEDPSNVRI